MNVHQPVTQRVLTYAMQTWEMVKMEICKQKGGGGEYEWTVYRDGCENMENETQ